MARVLLTAIAADIRGKLNGTVFSRNKGGLTMRNKVTPINPNTSYQSLQRSYTSILAKAWANTLTDAQRAAWKALGQTIGQKNIFGNNLILAGIACYQRINKIIFASGGSRLDNPPSSLNATGLTSLSVTANHVGPVLTIAMTPTPLNAPEGMYVFATPPLSPGIGNASAELRLIGFYSAAASGFSIYTAWAARFGAMPGSSGKRIAVSCQVVNINTGAITASTTASTLII